MRTIGNYLFIFVGCLFAATLLASLEGLVGVGVSRLVENDRHGFLMLASINLLVLFVWATRKKPDVMTALFRRFIGATVIPCILERGGFSTEVTFSIDTGDVERFVGWCYRDHVLNDDKQPFEPDELPPGAMLNGYVKCRRLRTEGRVALVEVPNGETIYVPCDELEEA